MSAVLDRRGRCPGRASTRAVRQPVLGLAQPVELEARGRDDDGRVGVVGLQRRQRLDRLAEALLVGDERAPRLQRVAHAGALERLELAAEAVLDLQRRRVLGAGAADVADRASSCSVRRSCSASQRVVGDVDAERAQVVLERLEQVGVDRQRAAVRLGGRQRQERRHGVRVPVDLELEARLADRLGERERGGRRARGRPAAAGCSASRAGPGGRRRASSSAAATASRERQRRAGCRARPRPAASSGGSSPATVSSRNAPRARRGGRRRRGRPSRVTARASHSSTSSATRQPVVALEHALHVRRRRVGLRRPPLARLPVEAPAGDRAHRVHHVRRGTGTRRRRDSCP